jgi:hypothetical protein
MRCAIFCCDYVFIISRVYTALTALMLLSKIRQFQQIRECRCKLAINTDVDSIGGEEQGCKNN